MAAHQYKPFLLKTALEAGEILKKRFNKVHAIEHKKNAGIVTEADKMAESRILKRIAKHYPQSAIIAEESGSHSGQGELTWVIDPLDGTSNYAHGFPWFCVSIGVYENQKAKAGVVYQPITDEMFYAEKGKGAWLNNRRIRVSTLKKLDTALLGTGFYYSRGISLDEELEIFRCIQEASLGVRRPGSAALDLAFVACGRYEGFWERGLAPWDVAAGMLLVEEAGGKLTRYDGKPASLFDKELLATNGAVHRAMVRLIQQSLQNR